jgi:hypothetical protein
MKYLSILLLSLFCAGTIAAQTTRDTVPPYKKDLHIPNFSILQPDSTLFTKALLPNNYEYTAIVYFSPDCGHCMFTTSELLKHMDSLSNVFFVFVSYKPLADIKEFYDHYHLNLFPNIRMGHESEYAVISFYQVASTPFVAVYNRKGTLTTVFDPPNHPVMEVSQLINLVNQK